MGADDSPGSAPSSTRTLKAEAVSPTRRVLNHDEVSCECVRNVRPDKALISGSTVG